MSSSCSVAVTASSSDPAVWPLSLPILCFGSSWTGILGERRKLESAFGSHEVLRVLLCTSGGRKLKLSGALAIDLSQTLLDLGVVCFCVVVFSVECCGGEKIQLVLRGPL